MSTACRGQAGSAGRGAGEGIASLVWSQNLSRESMLFFICPLKTGDTAGRGAGTKGYSGHNFYGGYLLFASPSLDRFL